MPKYDLDWYVPLKEVDTISTELINVLDKKVIYLIGSLRNPDIAKISNQLEEATGHEVFSDWRAAGILADDSWQEYMNERGKGYIDALDSYAAQHVFRFDDEHLRRSDIVVLVMPAGRSGHLELGVSLGRGKRGYILMDKEPDRYDVMYNFCTKKKDGSAGVFFDINALIKELGNNG